jgi:predicted O-methyltransferase YrrM
MVAAKPDDAAALQTLSMAGDPALAHVSYMLVRAVRPDFVIEVGVATGVVSSFVLAALEDNGHGELQSIDLPPMSMKLRGYVGAAAPNELRSRWVYHWGSSRRLLPKVFAQLKASASVFIFDADRSYESMCRDLKIAWDRLSTGGWIIVNTADLYAGFRDSASAFGVEPIYVANVSKPGCVGLLRKPV